MWSGDITSPIRSLPSLYQDALSGILHILPEETVFLRVGTNPFLRQGDGSSEWRRSTVIRCGWFEGDNGEKGVKD